MGSISATVMGVLFGRRLGRVGDVGRTSSTVKWAGRTAREKADFGRAEARVEEYQETLAELETGSWRAVDDAEDLALGFEPDFETRRTKATRADFDVERPFLAWVPARIDASGAVEVIGTLES